MGSITRRPLSLLGIALVALVVVPPALGAPLLPDLQTRPLPTSADDPEIVDGPSGKQIAFANGWSNRGRGPFETAPAGDASTDDCDGDGVAANDVLIEQRVYEDTSGDGVFDRDTETDFTESPGGCMFHHPTHNHFHVGDVGLYSLHSEPTGRLVGTSVKISFCLLDVEFFADLPGAPPEDQPYYDACNAEVQGVSIGWFDEYSKTTDGQQIDLGGAGTGNYCLRSEADPQSRFVEANESNNVAEQRYLIDPGDEQVSPLAGVCDIPDHRLPQTKITRGPQGTTLDRTPRFRFRADETSTFECRLDHRRWRSCSSPKRYGGPKLGPHKFKVRATDLAGELEPKPAKRRFEIVAG